MDSRIFSKITNTLNLKHRFSLLSGFVFLFLIPCSLMSSSCKKRFFNSGYAEDSDFTDIKDVEFDRNQLLQRWRFDRITPTGEKIMAAALEWRRGQEFEAQRYAKPAQCANNVSRVLEMAGLTSYSSPLLMDMVNYARRRGGLVIELPKQTRTIAKLIEENFAGALPVGTLISGCLNRDCSGDAGDGHISVVGHVDSNDHLHLWHNNWYRPENRPWRTHMIPLDWYQSGYLRKWMSTPWISRVRNEIGQLANVGVVIPEIDDLDPTNYYVTLTIIPEILAEMKKGLDLRTDGEGGVMPFKENIGSRPTQPQPLPSPPPLVDCQKLKTISPMPTNLRAEPNGKIICKLPLGTPVERVSSEAAWTKIKATCPDGFQSTGYALSALLVPVCEQ